MYSLRENKLLRRNIVVTTIPSAEGRSSPQHVVDNAVVWVEKNEALLGSDEVWIVLDVDRHNLAPACSDALRRNFNLAISNPCFEVWLILHFQDMPDEIVTAEVDSSAPSQCKSHWRLIEKSLDFPTLDQVHDAILRAKSAESQAGGFKPKSVSSGLYKLVERIVVERQILI